MRSLTKLARSLSKVKFSAAKHAPEIFMYAGIAGTAVATVIACKKTENMHGIVDEHKEKIDDLKKQASELPMNEYRKEMTKVYATTGLKVVRNYAFPATVFTLSVASIIHGKNMYKKWYVDTSAALAAVTADYNNLYDNLVQQVGEEKAKEIKAGIITEEVEEVTVDKKGKEKVVKKEVKKLSDKGSFWTLHYDEDTADEWYNDMEMNYSIIKAKIAQMQNNIAVRETGHLFWWEAVEYMFGSKGLKKILKQMEKEGRKPPLMCGWLYDSDKSEQINADFVYDPTSKADFFITLIPEGNIYEFDTYSNKAIPG